MTAGWLSSFPAITPSSLRRAQRPLPFPLDEADCRVCDLGRDALWIGLGSLGLEPGDELLMPAYHCGTEVGPVVQCGVIPRFWEGTEDLEPDPEELESLIGPRTRGLFLIHHLGFAQDASRWSRWCQERGLLLIEDVASAWLGAVDGRPLGSWGALSIFSPWKMLGLPEGAALVCDSPPSPITPRAGVPLKPLLKAVARGPAQRFSLAVRLHRRRREPADSAPRFDVREPGRGISCAVLALIRRLADQGIAETRRRNYEWLRGRLGDRIPPPFNRAPGEGCPLGFPVQAEDKLGLRRHLSAAGVEGVDFWPTAHPAVPANEFPRIAHRRATTILVPVHQGLAPGDLDRIGRAIGEWRGDL